LSQQLPVTPDAAEFFPGHRRILASLPTQLSVLEKSARAQTQQKKLILALLDAPAGGCRIALAFSSSSGIINAAPKTNPAEAGLV